MKRTVALVILVAGLSMVSCKKSYTCDCTVTQTATDSTGTYTFTYRNTISNYDKKMKKAQAQAACDHEQIAVQSNFTALITKNGNTPMPANRKISTSCSLR